MARTVGALRRERAEPPPIPRFEGSAFSKAEIDFLLEHLGESPVTALADEVELPDGLNPEAIRWVLDITFNLELFQNSQREQSGDDSILTWVGFDEVRRVLEETKLWRQQRDELKRATRGAAEDIRRAAGAPSLCFWDPDTDVAYLGGIGADSGKVLTALGEGGKRIPLYTELQGQGRGTIQTLRGIATFIGKKAKGDRATTLIEQTPNELEYIAPPEGQKHASVRCPICGAAENYTVDSEPSKRVAVRKIHSHLRTEKTQVDKHRLLLKRLESGRAGRTQE